MASAPSTIYNSRNSKDLIVTARRLTASCNLQQQKFKRLNSLKRTWNASRYIYNSRNSKDLIVACIRQSENTHLQQQKFKRLNSPPLAVRRRRLRINNSRNSKDLIVWLLRKCRTRRIYNSRNSKDLIVRRGQYISPTYLQQQKFKRLNSLTVSAKCMHGNLQQQKFKRLNSQHTDGRGILKSTTVEIQKT